MKKRPSILNFILAAGLCPGAVLYAQNEAGVINPSESKIMISALRDAYAAFNRGDIDGALKPLDPNIEWSEPEDFPGGGSYHRRAGVKSYLTQSRAGLAEGTSKPEEFFTVGSRIVVFVHAHIRPKDSSEWHDVKLADVYTIRDGRAVQMRAFADRQQALNWARSKSLSGK
jgi:ketosteroid isomerase-like protein